MWISGYIRINRIITYAIVSFGRADILGSHMIIDHPHWGENTQMCRMWRCIWHGQTTEKVQVHPHWGEATQMHIMILCIFTSSHHNTFLAKAKSVQKVRLLFNRNIKPQTSSNPTSAHLQWKKVTSRATKTL